MAIHSAMDRKDPKDNNQDNRNDNRNSRRDYQQDDNRSFDERVNNFRDGDYQEGGNDNYNRYDDERRKLNPNRGMTSAFEARNVSKRFSDLMRGFKTLIDNGDVAPAPGARLIEFDGERYGLVYPAVIALLPAYNHLNEITDWAYSVLIVEDENNKLHDREENIGGEHYTLPRTAFDLYDEYYNSCVQETIIHDLTAAGLPSDANLVYGRVSCVYNTVDVTDLGKVKSILQELGRQCMTPLYPETVQEGVNETAALGNDIRNNDYALESSLEFKPTAMVDDSGLPIARDLLIRVKAYSNGQRGRRNRQNNSGIARSVYPIVDVSCMLDLIHVDESQQMAGPRSRRDMYRRQQDDHMEPIYVGNVIVTHIGNQDTYTTISRALIALATATIAQSDEVFPEMLKPARGANQDLGSGLAAIGYQVPDESGEYGPLLLDSAEFTRDGNAALLQTVFEVVYPDLMMSIDIPEAALGSRVLSLFQGNGVEDNKAIALAMDSLTDGRFSEVFDYKDPIVRSVPTMVPLGYWVDSRGEKRDLREIGYLAALDYAGRNNDMVFIEEWEETWLITDPARGAAARLALMAEIVGGRDNVVVKGYAWRYVLERDFLEAVFETLAETGIAPTFSNLAEGERRRLKNNLADLEDYLVDHRAISHFASRMRRGGSRRDSRGTMRHRSNWR